jgi:hypothetical protein
MELRARIRPTLCRAGLMAAAAALLVPLTGTATADAKKAPVVKRVTPKKVHVGETLTIRGRHFRSGIGKNLVAFKRKGAKVVMVRAGRGTSKRLKVKLPKRLEKLVVSKNGMRVATRIRVRILASRFGRRFTSAAKSPLLLPIPEAGEAAGDCDADGIVNGLETDADDDLLSDKYEASLSVLLDRCNKDTDGDGVEDGYEVASARDLNDDEHQNPNSYTPYPRKRPYPNALDKTDGGTDHDGDSLTLLQEYQLWQLTIANGGPRSLTPLSYSAGMQHSVYREEAGRRKPNLRAVDYEQREDSFRDWLAKDGATYAKVALSYPGEDFGDLGDQWYDPRQLFNILDFDRSGLPLDPWEEDYYAGTGEYLNDAERDEDADGLPNWWETSGCMQPSYWKALYEKEKPFPLTYEGTSFVDDDTDGDKVRDGADDEDHDDVPNVMECSRVAAGGIPPVDPPTVPPTPQPALGAVNPYNPCMPHRLSRACPPYVEIGTDWAPFGIKQYEVKN